MTSQRSKDKIESVQTKVIKVDPRNFTKEELEPAASLLRSGGLVAFPTETVYGIGANAFDPLAIKRLSLLKGRQEGKSYTLHIANPEDLRSFVGSIPPIGKVLIKRFWPGPLTIVFPSHSGPGVGVRVPDSPVAREFIALSGVPVVAPSANPAGKEPAVDAQGVLTYFEGELDALIDAGRCRLGISSTVVQTHLNKIKILREGAIAASVLRSIRCVSILFVCTGSSCRSPMAEALMKMALSRSLSVPVYELEENGYYVRSAGTAAFEGGKASANAIEVLREEGYDLSSHISKTLTREMLEEADIVVALDTEHVDYIKNWLPHLLPKVILIRPEGIKDPMGQPIEVYRNTANLIRHALPGIVEIALGGDEK